MRNVLVFALAMVALALLAEPTSAQTIGRLEGRQASPGGYYFNAQPGEATTRLSIWGHVARPGVYEVGPDFTLASVLSMAGGPSRVLPEESALELKVHVFRGSQEIYSAAVDQLALNAEAVPSIQDGDIVELVLDRSVHVNVWGTVRDPGLKVVGPTDTIRSAISQAGGPTLTALRGNGSREVTLRVTQSATGATLYDGLLYDLPDSINETPLSDGDVLAVEVRERNGWEVRDTLTVAGIALSGVVAITQVLRLFESN